MIMKNEVQKIEKKNLMIKVQSESSSDKEYVIDVMKTADGQMVFRCSCPSWRYNNNPKDPHKARVCKHIQNYVLDRLHPNTRRWMEKGVEGGLRV